MIASTIWSAPYDLQAMIASGKKEAPQRTVEMAEIEQPKLEGLASRKTALSSSNNQLIGGDWNHGILNDFPIMLGMEKSSQLTFTPSFFRGVGRKTTNQLRVLEAMNLSTYHPWNILKYYSASFRGCVSMVQWLCPYLQSFNPPGIQCDSCKTLLYVIYEYDIYIYIYIMCVVSFCRMTHTNTLTLNWPPKKWWTCLTFCGYHTHFQSFLWVQLDGRNEKVAFWFRCFPEFKRYHIF